MIKGIVSISIFSLLLAGIGYLINVCAPIHIVHFTFYWFVGYFCLVNIGIHSLVLFCKEKLGVEYHLLLLGAIGGRMIIALFSFLFVSFFVQDERMLFAANFSVVYLSFLVFEIISVLSNLRPNSSQVKNQ